MTTRVCLLTIGLIFTIAGAAEGQTPLGSSFTYQGLLKNANVPVSPSANFVFSLWNDPTSVLPANQIGSAITQNGVPVTDGLFTVVLNQPPGVEFGTNAFNGDARWLEITVNGTTLSPRQQLSPTPHALALPGLYTQQNVTSPNIIGGHNGNLTETSTGAAVVGATIAGGGSVGIGVNKVTDNYGTVGGGANNRAGGNNASATNELYPTVAGGRSNVAQGDYSSVGGGQDQSATGDYSTIAGGEGNVASGARSTVAGGQLNTASGSFSLAAGRRAKANHDGAIVVADSTDADFASTAANQFLVRATGGVGIGTNSPTAPLDVSGSVVSSGASGGRLQAKNPNNQTADVSLDWLNDVARIRVGGGGAGAGNGFDIQRTSDVSLLRILNSGALGIGTPNPVSALHIGDGDVLDDDYNSPATFRGRRANGSMAAPTAVASGEAIAQFVGTGHDGTGYFDEGYCEIVADEPWTTTAHGTFMRFFTTNNSSVSTLERMRIAPNGNVGIGTTDPLSKLHILGNGDALALEGTTHTFIELYPDGFAAGRKGWIGYGSASDNNITIKNDIADADIQLLPTGTGVVRVPVLEITGADLAEKFPVSEKVEQGRVVEIDPNNPGKLRLARGAYNRRVAGVVSGANGLNAGAILGNLPGSESAPAIALSGRVWVHCDASSGAIEPGDLLTTSDTPGHAMRVEDFARAQGAIIGKAMTSLVVGQSLVLVLVNLQ